MTEAAARSIRLGIEGAVATITLDRPAALNALTIPMKYELLEALEAVRDDAAVRAVVLTGAGRAFCAGQDLKERLEPAAPSLGEELRERYNPIVRAMRSLPKPIVGAINGAVGGAGPLCRPRGVGAGPRAAPRAAPRGGGGGGGPARGRAGAAADARRRGGRGRACPRAAAAPAGAGAGPNGHGARGTPGQM